ncbi:MAG: DNA internalization-related competence protein ComEC/Rec2 [Legionellaceae bacterium]|nr:DNA internalization-related competence protein ComEC/Rec2 [Legionellaceae bacterium]
MEILCFFSGVAFVYLKNGYALGLLCVALFFRPRIFLCACFFMGAIWALLHAMCVVSTGMPKTSVIPRANIIGVISSIPDVTSEKTQFEFKIKSLNDKPAKARVLLTCYDECPHVSAGQVWRVDVKLKKPQNLGNPGGFNRVRSLDSHHIEWVGYTRRNTFEYLEKGGGIQQQLIKVRAYFSQHLNQHALQPETAGILQALTLGLGHQITQENWGLFRRTGTTHLMVISGAHIGLVAGLTYGGLRRFWSRFGGLALRLPAQRIASIGALLVAFIYSVLAGFGVPAERALIVCFFMLLRHIGHRSFTVWQAFRYALLAVLLFEPHSVMMPGFYLSFVAVGILITVNQIIQVKGIQKMICMQLACLFGLMPLTLFLFSYGSINGFFANFFAIPWVGFIIIPIGLLTVFLGTQCALDSVSLILDKAVGLLLMYLNWIDGFARINLDVALNTLWCVVLLMFAFGVALIFPIKRFLPVLLVFFVSGLYEKQDKIKWGEARIDVLDVAQGLAVMIRTAHHQLLYDTGVKFYRGGDMGQLAIIPYLKTLRTKYLDMIIISHPDLDHRGGLVSLEAAYTVRALLVDNPKFYHRGESCHQYSAWRWDGVFFEFLPMPLESRKKNNHSCILKVTTDFGSMLLTGDIERSAERYLVKNYAEKLVSSFLLVPHHESKTSSSSLFLEHVSPRAAIASYGFDNRYHFPHADAEARYEQQEIPVYSTESCGLVRIDLYRSSQFKPPECTKYNK